MKYAGLCAVFLTFLLTACKKNNSDRNPVPQISFVSMTPAEIKSGGNEEIHINFRFKDGDADLFNEEGTTTVTLSYTYEPGTTSPYKLPAVPSSLLDPDKMLEGDATIIIPTSSFVLDSAHAANNPFHFEFFVTDVAGNQSNTVTTPDVTIVP